MRVLITGISTRAAAESAARAGFDVVAIDAFGDLDQHPSVRGLSLPRDFGAPFAPRALVRAASTVAADAVVYLSTLENHPRTVTALSRGRELWGNASAVLGRVRDPFLLERVLRTRGFAVPSTMGSDPVRRRVDPWGQAPLCLMKPLASGGGQRVRPWPVGARLPRRYYGQRFMSGTPGSVVLVSARGRAVPLGLSRQIVGDPSFGATHFRYCGSILTPSSGPGGEFDRRFADEASALAAAVSEEFGLLGVAGIDFVIDDGRPCVLEVNPRWCASMELVERAYGMSVFAAHAAACRTGALPSFDFTRARDESRAYGKAIVFARRDLVAGDTRPWLEDPSVRDVPRPGDRIPRGQPVCTVFADAADELACHAALVRRAERIYAELARTSPTADVAANEASYCGLR
jgi:predicted ATP-grasp superfamily ATP-dependent carboligase